MDLFLMARFRVNILEGVFYGDAVNFSERLIIFDTSFSFFFSCMCDFEFYF